MSNANENIAVKFRPDRLRTLAKHLESDEMGHEEFDFSHINIGEGSNRGCGTAGCAMGEFPFAFPDDWKFDGRGFVVHRMTGGMVDTATDFFGITSDDQHSLFEISVWPAPWNEESLTKYATASEVAASIRRFIPWKQKQLEGSQS